MTFLYPPALLAIVVIIAPVLIHLFVHRQAERLVFPTLRFIAPSRLASMRRRMLDDVPLLAVRIAILVAAISALAAPLANTPARQREWNTRIVRAVVVPRGFQPIADAPQPFLSRVFETADLRDGILRALAWLDAAPPARRELVVSSAFSLGSLTTADISTVPVSIGLRFERTGALPESRTVADARLLAGSDTQVARDLTFAGARTSVREIQIADRASFPVEVDAPAEAKAAIDAAIVAVLSQRVWAPPADRRARLILGAGARSLQGHAVQGWMADAIARLSRDADLQSAASATATGLSDPRFKSAPWVNVVPAADGTPVIVATGSTSELVVVAGVSAYDLVMPLLLRSIVNGLAIVPDVQQAEVVAIPDAQLRAWSRPAQLPGAPRLSPQSLENVQDDRRWFWAAALGLLALEAWMRRARAFNRKAVEDQDRDVARVA